MKDAKFFREVRDVMESKVRGRQASVQNIPERDPAFNPVILDNALWEWREAACAHSQGLCLPAPCLEIRNISLPLTQSP